MVFQDDTTQFFSGISEEYEPLKLDGRVRFKLKLICSPCVISSESGADLGGGGALGKRLLSQEFDRNNYQRVPPLNNLLNFFSKGAFGAGVFGLYIKENFEV